MATTTPLHFLGFEINRIVFEKPPLFIEGEFKLDVQHVTHVNTENKNIFACDFIVTISTENKTFNLQVQAFSHFEIKGDVSEEVYKNYTTINAPAIAYPYLRAFISNVVIQTGMKPIILPPLNFTILPQPVETESNPIKTESNISE